MFKNTLTYLSFILFFSFGYSQPKNSDKIISTPVFEKDIIISGKVFDRETNEPLEYATISFFSQIENKIITGGITDIKGAFKITVLAGVYDISIEYISFKTQTLKNRKIISNENIGDFYLELDLETLDAIEVIAEKTTVEIRLDKKIYNVGKDLTVSGGTVSDVLDNVPSVSVDGEGNVALRGNNNVRILINGKPSGLVGLDSTEALRQLPAEAIEKVEVITSPSARYEAEGTAGILNIILRRSKFLGLNGVITANAGYPKSAGVSGNINYRTGNVNIFNTLSYRYGESPGYWYNYTTFKSTGNVLDEKRDWEDTRKGLTNNFGVEWYINDSASITSSMVVNDGNNNNNSTNNLIQFDSNGTLISESLRYDPRQGTNKTIQYSFNFTKNFNKSGHKLTFDFQHEDTNRDELSLINVDGLNTDILTQIRDQSRILLRTDYVLPIGENSQIEMGYRGDFNNNATDYKVELLNLDTNEFEIDKNLTNLFNFKNYILAAYAQYGSKINKFSYLLGLRMENTQLTLDQTTSGDFEKRNFTGLFPTVNLSYEFSETENMTLGYNRRLQRPNSFYLNPFPSRSSLTNIFQGDPGLNPTYSGKFDLGYLNRMGKFIINSSIYYQHSTNLINWVSIETGDVAFIDGEEIPVVQRGPANVGMEDRYGVDFNITYTPSKKWRMNTDFNLFNSTIEGELDEDNFDSKNVSWNLRFSNKYSLPGDIDWQTNMNYRGPSKDAQNDRQGTFTTNFAFSKDLFKERASIAFNIRDVFNSGVYLSTIETDSFINEREIRFRGVRSYNLSFTYRFNQKKKPERFGQFNGGGAQI